MLTSSHKAADHHVDVVIIGAGPVGLFAVFELGLLNMTAAVVDVLDRPGGQCTELYPEKPIYDIPGYPKVDGQELVDRLMEQIRPFQPTFYLEQRVDIITRDDGSLDDADTTADHQPEGKLWRVYTSEHKVLTCSAVFVAAGTGTFVPRRLKLPRAEEFEGKSLFYSVRGRESLRGSDLIIAGGGDSAIDWTMDLLGITNSLTLIHRRDRFRAAPAMVERMREAAADGKINLAIGDLSELHGADGQLEGVSITSEGETKKLPANKMLAFYGLQIELGPVKHWNLDLYEGKQIIVDTEKFQSSVEGIFAIGDINWYPGKLKLILSGFHEAALAAHAAFHLARPDEKLRFQYTTSSSALQKRLNAAVPPSG